MPICIHCGQPTSSLYTVYGRHNIVCTPCARCGAPFADVYLECEIVVVVLDLILVKPRAYRHLLFNRPTLQRPTAGSLGLSPSPSSSSSLEGNNREKERGGNSEKARERGSTTRTGASEGPLRRWYTLAKRFLALLLVDSYLRWFYLCAPAPHPTTKIPSVSNEWSTDHSASASPPSFSLTDGLDDRTPAGKEYQGWSGGQDRDQVGHMLWSYVRVVGATGLETLALHATVLLLASGYVHFTRHLRARRFARANWTHHNQRSVQSPLPRTLENEAQDSAPSVDAKSKSANLDLAKARVGLDDESEDATAFHGVESATDTNPDTDASAKWATQKGETLTLTDEKTEASLDLYRPSLVPTALLLSSLTTFFLLSLILLWESKFPRAIPSHPNPSSTDPSAHSSSLQAQTGQLQALSNPRLATALESGWKRLGFGTSRVDFSFEWNTNWAIRSLIGGLSAGVALAVILPRTPHATVLILLCGWYVQSLVRAQLGIPAASGACTGAGAGTGSGSDNRSAARDYCFSA